MATLLDSHSSSFSILESTFELNFVQGFQANYGESIIQKVGVFNIFKFLANYMVLKMIVSMWGYN